MTVEMSARGTWFLLTYSLTIWATNGGVTCAAGLSLIGMSSPWFFVAYAGNASLTRLRLRAACSSGVVILLRVPSRTGKWCGHETHIRWWWHLISQVGHLGSSGRNGAGATEDNGRVARQFLRTGSSTRHRNCGDGGGIAVSSLRKRRLREHRAH